MNRQEAKVKAIAAYALATEELPKGNVTMTQHPDWYEVTIYSEGNAHDAEERLAAMLQKIPNGYRKEHMELKRNKRTATMIEYNYEDDEE